MSTNLRVFTTHDNGDTLLKFVFEPSTRDRELIQKFGDPEIEVGGTWLLSATLQPPTIVGGVITAVDVATQGDLHAYSAQRPIVLAAEGSTGSGATFSPALNINGQLGFVNVTAGGSNYSVDTVVRIVSGGHETKYPSQKVKLLAGFPFTRRINTITPGDTSLEQLVTLYRSFINTNVQNAMTALRALDTPPYDLTTEVVYQP